MGLNDAPIIQAAGSGPASWMPEDSPVLLAAPRPQGPREAESLRQAVMAGLEASATGLALARKLPSTVLPENAPWYHRLASNAAGIVLDLPLSIAGAIPGGAAGTAVGGPGVGTAVGAGAGAFAAPMALREALMTAYSQDAARDWNDVWQITKSALTGGAKGAVIGGATLGAGKAAAPLVAGAGTVARVGVPLAAELGALTTTAAALEGHVPTARDFMDNAILLGGMKGAVHVAGEMRAIYAETGKRPEEIVRDAEQNPALKAELVQAVKDMPEPYRTFSVEERVKAALGDDPRQEIARSVLTEAVKGEPATMDKLLQEVPAVKMEYVTDSQTAQAVTRTLEGLFRNEIEAQTRGEVPAKQTMAEAIKKMASGIDDHIVGSAEAPSMLAARALLYRNASAYAAKELREQSLKPEAERSVKDDLRVYAALESAEIAYQNMRGAAAETGRALNILRQIKYDETLMPEAKALTNLFKKAQGKMTFQDIASMAAALKDPAQLARFASEIRKASTTEQLLEGWKAAILSGPQTHMANMMGNAMKFAVEIPETALVTTITAVRRAVQGDRMGFAEFKAKALAPLYGLKWGARDAMTIAGEAFMGEGTHLEKADVYRHAIPGKAGHWIRTPFRALQAEDVLFRTVAERGKAHEMAIERAVKEGFTPETREFNERVADYTMRPETGLDAVDAAVALKAVEQAGSEAVFAQRLGPHMEQAQAAMAGTWMGFVIPFVRTPVNLLSWAVQHSPGFLLSARWRQDFAAGGAARDKAVARVLVGSALTITALSLAQDGLLTGGGMFDPEERNAKTAAGWQPYSIKVGDTYYSYQRLEPVAKVLGFAADFLEMRDKLEADDQAKGMMALIAMFGNATISTTYLSGLAGSFNALTDPTRYGERWFEQYASSLVPKIVGQSAMMADPHRREVNGMIDAIQAQIPFLREKLMPARDVWGEPKKGERLFGALPVATSQESKDKVKSEAMRLELAISDVSKFLFEKGPLKPGERRIELTPEQRDVAREVSGKAAMSILSPIVNSDDWKNIPDFAKAEVYRKVLEQTRAQGRLAALPPEAKEREAMRDKILQEVLRQSKAAE